MRNRYKYLFFICFLYIIFLFLIRIILAEEINIILIQPGVTAAEPTDPNFYALSQASRLWAGMTATGNNVYAAVDSGDIYMQTDGAGNFVALSQASRAWYGMAAASNGNVYACVFEGDVYMQTN